MSKTAKLTGMAAFHGEGATHTRECECGRLVTVTGVAGPSTICDECAGRLLAFIFGEPGAEFPPEYRFPLDEVPLDDDGNPVSCGNRRDVPKARRRHGWAYLGLDTRHTEDVSEDLHVYACAVCGRDRQTRKAPAR